MMIKGIDISHWNGEIDFNKVKKAGYEFVIIKAGGSDKGFYTDSKFNKNYEKAKAAGLNVGAYYFVGKNFKGAESGKADAERFIKILSGKQFEYPVYVDIETLEYRYRDVGTDAAIAFCETMEKAGFFCGIYASDISGFKEMLVKDRITKYSVWVARYGTEPKYMKDYGMWQYSSRGRVDGIVGSVDLNYSRVDYAKTIKSKGFNGFKKPVKKKEVKE